MGFLSGLFGSASRPKVVTPKASAGEIALGNLAKEQWEYFKANYLPQINGYVQATLDATDNRNTKDLEQSILAGGMAQQFGGLGRTAKAGLLQAGAAPGSGRFAMGSTDMSRQQGMALGRGLAAYDSAAEDERMGGRLGIAQLGRGVAATATQGLGSVGRLQNAQNVMQDTAERAERQQLAGMLASLGGGMAGAYGAYRNNQRQQQNWQGYNDRLTSGGVWGYDKNGVWGNSAGVGFEPYSLTWPPVERG